MTQDKNHFVAEWTKEEQSIKIIFPNNYQLIAGKNKKELDEELWKMNREAVRQLASEKLIANESFRIFQSSLSEGRNEVRGTDRQPFNRIDAAGSL